MTDQLRIGDFTNVYRPVSNGVVTSVATFREGLSELGHSVYLFAPDSRGYVDEEPLVFRYPAFDFPGQMYPLTIPISPSIDWLIPRLKLHVLHANHPFLLGRVAARVSRQENLPLVFTYHTRYREYSHYVPAVPDSLVRELIDGWVGDYMACCHTVVAPSSSIAALLKERYQMDDGVVVVPTGIDLKHWQRTNSLPPVEGRFLVSAGRLAEEKNWECLIDAFARVVPSQPDLKLLILGDGAHRSILEQRVKEAGLGDRLLFMGRVPHAEQLAYLHAAELFCFASVSETQGLVTLEAMACGLPVAAVDATGTSDVVRDGENGLLTANDPEALAEAILRLLQDAPMHSAMSVRCLATAAEYDSTRVARRMVEVYRDAIERQRLDLKVKPVVPPTAFEERWRRFLAGEW